MSATFNQSNEDLLNLYYCSFEEDATGQACEALTEELTKEGFAPEILLKAQQEASQLFAKNSF